MPRKMHPRTPDVFAFLKQCADEHRTVTYGEIGATVGLAARGTALPLYYIRDQCLARGLPPLTAIVVRKRDGLPGVGLTLEGHQVSSGQMREMQSQVFAFDWSDVTLNITIG